MNPTEVGLSFHSPQRQSPAAALFILITFLRRSVRRFWFLFVLVFFQRGESRGSTLVGLLIVISIIQLVSSLIHYFRFYFYVDGDELILESRRVKTTRTNIPFNHIQTIEFEQGILHRFFNVVKVRIDTAGSIQAEMNLDALDIERAEALRAYILAQKAMVTADGDLLESEEALGTVTEVSRDELLLELEPNELVRIGLVQNHFRTAGIIIGFFFGLYQYVDEILDFSQEDVERYAEQYASQVEANFIWTMVLAGLPALLIAGVVLSVVQVFIRYYGFKAWATPKGFKLQSGLITRREQAATKSKIQLIRWYQTLLEVRLGISRVRLFQAASGAVKRKQAMTIPGCHEEHKEALHEVLISKEEQSSYTSHKISSKVILRRVLLRGVLPSLGLGLATIAPLGWYATLFLLLIPVNLWTARRYYSRHQLLLNERSLKLQHGVWGYRGVFLPWYKVQAVQVSTSPFERRNHLHTVRLSTAGGTVKLAYLPSALAQEISNYALYQIETSRQSWM